MPELWAPASHVFVLIDRDAYGPVGAGTRSLVRAVMVAPYLAVVALAVPGLAALRVTPGAVFLLLFLVYYNALHVVTYGQDRFRLPVMPVLFLAAGEAWTRWRAGTFSLTPARRAADVGARAAGAGRGGAGPVLRMALRHSGLDSRARGPEAPRGGGAVNDRVAVGRLVLVPALITLAVTVLRLVGELMRWDPRFFSREAGGAGAIVGIVWLVPVFGVYFARKLVSAGEGPGGAGEAPRASPSLGVASSSRPSRPAAR